MAARQDVPDCIAAGEGAERAGLAERQLPGAAMLGSCLTWEGAVNAGGYGWMGKPDPVTGSRLAHRKAWRESFGDPGNALVLHKCNNPPCIRPGHLYLGDDKDNARDRAAAGRHHESQKTHCPHGHLLDGTTATSRGNGTKRFCRTCRKIQRDSKKRQGAIILLLLLLFGCRDVLSEKMLSRVQGDWTSDCQTLLYYQRNGDMQSPVYFYGHRESTGYIEVWEIHYDNGETVIQTRKLADWSSSCK